MDSELVRAAARFAWIDPEEGMILVPGHQGKQYWVRLTFAEPDRLMAECRRGDGEVCPSRRNGRARPCYHALAAALALFANHLAICQEEKDAMRLSNLYNGRGSVLTLERPEGGQPLFLVHHP